MIFDHKAKFTVRTGCEDKKEAGVLRCFGKIERRTQTRSLFIEENVT